MNTLLTVQLRVGDVLVRDDNAQVVQCGVVLVGEDGTVKETAGTIMQSVIMEEAYERHDDGHVVFEISDSFTGPWRD